MPDALIHPTSRELAAFGRGQLAEATAAAVASHLDVCPVCRQVVETLSPGSFRGQVRTAQPNESSLPPGRSATLLGGTSGGRNEVSASPPPPTELPPELLNHPRYRMIRELGRGGMGVVYQAVQTLMDRHVAVKVINPSVLAHPDALPRFQSEVKTAAKLDHPNIVRAHDAEQVGSLHLLVMEYVEGTNLADLVQRKGPLPIAHACHFIRQAALGLQHAFEQGMVHRDIKPQNLMVTSKGVVKILDFGLARLRGGQTQGGGLTEAGSFMGTPEYVSPEQATDARTADTRADLYSLGCTLYFLLTGEPPFAEDTAVKMILAHIEKEAPSVQALRPEVPAALSAVMARLLAKDPKQRYQQPVEVARVLVPFINATAKPGATQVEGPPPRTSAPAATPALGTDTRKASQFPTNAPAKSPVQDVSLPAGPTDPFTGLAGGSPPPPPNADPVVAPTPAGWYRRPPVLAGFAAALLALGLGVWLLVGLISRAKVTTTAAGEALVVLKIDQPGAQVSVDDRKITVPVLGDNQVIEIPVEPGRHHLRVSKDGFEAFTQDIELNTGKSDPIPVHLEPVKIAVVPPEERPKDPIQTKESPTTKRKPKASRPRIKAPPPPKPAPSLNPSDTPKPPDPVAVAVQRAREDYDAALKGAGERVLAAFEQKRATLTADSKVKDEDRLKAIKALEAEKVSFQEKGTLPWSPRMRSAALAYLDQINAATIPLGEAYDQALAAYQRQDGGDQATRALAAEKKEILTPKVVGVWKCRTVPRARRREQFTYTLYANGQVGGTSNSKDTWKLTSTALEITLHRSNSAGRWIDTCTIAPLGQDFSGKPGNRARSPYAGRLVRESN